MSDIAYRIQSDQRAFRDWQEDGRSDNSASLARARKTLPIALRNYISDTQQMYLFAYFGEGLTMPEIAERYGVNKSTVSRTIGRGLDRLYDCLRFVSPEFRELDEVRKTLRIDPKTGYKQRKLKRHYTKRRKYSA